MAIAKPPKLKNASDFMTKKKVKNSTPEEYYEVTSQKLGLYDLDTPYSGSPNARREKETEKRSLLPKVSLQEIRDMSENQDLEYLSQEEVGERNRLAHQKDKPKQSLMEKLTSNVTDENRATLGVQKKPSAPRINSQVATLAGKQPEQYSQQQSAEGDRFLSDGNIKGQVANTEKQKTDIGAVGRSLRDLPRNLASGALNALEQGSELLTFGMQSNNIKPRTRESWEKMNQTNTNPNKPKTYEEYLASIDKMNQDTKDFQKKVASVGSEVTSDTTLFEKMVKGAAQSLPSSLLTASMGGGLAGMAGAFVSNPIVVETIRTTPLFASGTHSGLKAAEELGLTGAKKYSYAVLSGLLEAGTERLSSLGLEGKLLGKKTSGGVGGTKEFLRAIFEESGSEMLNEVGQQLLTGQYTNYEDFELDFENIIVAGGSAALMGGFGAVGELSNGLKYKTVGTEDNMVIIETEDGRREKVNPEIVMRHQLANGRTARKAQELLKADAEIQDLAKNFTATEEVSSTMQLEDTTTPQEQFNAETEPSMPIEENPLTEPLSEQKEEVVARERGSSIENLNVKDIGVDAKRFQFKESTDSDTGAGTSLQGTDTFNPNLAGVVTVWRDNNGKDWIINGHHRLELARRSNTNNIDARILYESDGVTESLARQIGAEQNIAEGKGSAKDAAQIFRESGYTVKELAELGLSIKDKFIEQAYNISRLNDRLWDKVVTKQLKETQASMIGEAFPNDSDKQNAVMDYINEEGSITDKELKEVIDGVRFSETNYEEQYTLMGLETVAKSNFKEKVKLTTKIKQSIGSEKTAFSKLVKAQSAKKIEDAGNVLNQQANESRLDLLQNINEIIDFGKNRQGDPINIIINKYANEVQNGAKINSAADKAIEEITAIVQDGGYIALAMKGIEEQSNQQMMIGDEFNETQQDEPGDVQGINQDSERAEIEGQGSLFDFTETENATTQEVSAASEREPLETRLNNMISKNLIDSPNNRRVATNLNKKIVELGGKDRAKEFEKKVKAPKVKTISEYSDLISSDDDLMSNNMAMEAEIEPMDSAEPVTTDLPEIEMMEGYKTSATKKSLLKAPNIPQAYKDNVIESDPMFYETSQRIARELEANQEIETKTYDVATKEVLANHKVDPKLYQSKEGQAMIQALIKKNIALREQYKDNGFYQSQYEDLQKVWRETGTDLGQSLNMRKQLYGDTIEGKLIEAERIIEDSKTKEHKELEDRMNKIVDDIFEKTLELDENGKVKPDAEFDEVIADIKREFGLTNAWIQMLRRSLEEGTLTKVRMKEIIKEKMGIPTLTMAEVDKITEIMKRLDALDPKSETYAKDKEAILQDATMVYAQKDVTFWTKLSTYQTMAMLMNVKTTLRNEIGNLMGFTTAQVDDVFSFFFDEGIARITKQRGTVNPRSPFKLKYKDGVVKSFEAYGSFLADASENKYVKRRVFAPGSMMGKLEGVMGVMLSDARWKQPRVEFLLEQIAATEKYAKERGLEYDAETAKLKENINFIADYDTFNFNSKPAQVLDGVVKSMNKFGNKDFGLGTLFAKFAKTPMNIIQYQLDHIGADLLREGVKLSKLSKKIGFENALKQNQGRISRALGKTATGMTYVTLGALLSNLGAFVEEEEDKDIKNILEAQGIKGGYFNFSALRRSITSGTPSSYKDGDTVLSVNWMLPVAPFLLLGSRFANARDAKEEQGIFDTLQTALEVGGASLQDFAELPFNRTLGILTNSYDSGMDKFNKLVGGTVTGFVPSVVKQVAQGIDPTSKQYSKNSGEAVVQQIKATIPGLRNTAPNRFDVTGETQTMTDNSTTAGNIFEMLLNPAYRDTIEADKDLQKVLDLNKKVGLPSLPKITNGYFSYKSNRYEMTQDEHQEFQSVYWNAYKRTYNKKNDGNFVNAHDYAMNQAKMNYLKKKKVRFETTSSGNLK